MLSCYKLLTLGCRPASPVAAGVPEVPYGRCTQVEILKRATQARYWLNVVFGVTLRIDPKHTSTEHPLSPHALQNPLFVARTTPCQPFS